MTAKEMDIAPDTNLPKFFTRELLHKMKMTKVSWLTVKAAEEGVNIGK